ncbi:PIR Superfamily Protein [Plasmodium ovale wallikeri]|uniref:PIR Superfamily Protein n=1 Tax=Plasmodium ovale wallikeri TaxID=864142 RepID=A0A1A9AL39_PLAOA|nr:PIR Superfamily Protein [Plasmodium ovale wallikeri]
MSTRGRGMPYLYALKNDEKLSSYYNDWGVKNECAELHGKLNINGFNEFCVTLTGLLRELKQLDIYLLFDNDRCTPVTMWMYDNLYNVVSKKNSKLSVPSVIGNIIELWNKNVADKSCKIYTDPYSEDTFNKAKILHDYALDYENIKNKIQQDKHECTKSFKQYVDNAVEIYKDIRGNCATNPQMHYCGLFNKIQAKYKQADLSEFVCTKEKDDPLPAESSFQFQDDSDYFPPTRSDQLKSETPSPDASTSALDIVLPLLGISATLLILYKFTPFGSLLRYHLIKKKYIRHISNEHESKELSENEYESMIMHSYCGEHNIGYHPS